MSVVRTRGGLLGTYKQSIVDKSKEIKRNNSAASVAKGRLLTNLIEMASRGARTLVDNLDEKKVLSSDCTICFATLNRDKTRTREQHLWVRGGGGRDRQPANARH